MERTLTDWHAQHTQQAAKEGDNRGGGKRKREEAAAFAKRVPLLKKIEDMAELVEGLRAHVDDHAAALAACQAMARLIGLQGAGGPRLLH